MAKIKYLGSADRVLVEKGENFSGRLADPLTKTVEWNAGNNFLIDSDEAGLSAEALSLLLEDKVRFKDVSDLKKIPTSLNEQIFRGLGKNDKAEDDAADVPVVPVGGQSVEPVGGQSVEPGAAPTPTTTTTTTPARSTAGRG